MESILADVDPLFNCMHPFYTHKICSIMDERHLIFADQADVLTETKKVEECSSKIYQKQERKRRLSANQLETLERSFQEEAKLAPMVKMNLSKELNLEPRQVAVWFQNRRARHKTRVMELLYDELKQQFNAIFNEKQRLQEEVQQLQTMLRIHKCHNHQVSTVHNEIKTSEEPAAIHDQSLLVADLHQIKEAWNCYNILYGLP